jgi:transposase
VIQAKLDQGLSVQRIYQDLRTEHGFMPSYYSVLRFVRKLHPHGELPYRRLEKAPGVEAQVDFGTGGWILGPEGKRSRPHVLRVVLSHSRKAYSEAVARQTTDAFVQCLENAFHLFGGVPQTLVIDNLKAAVTKADWFDPELNPKIEVFARHYGTVILPTKPRTPRHKGKVERGIDYVQENALKGRVFASLAEQNRHLQEWEATVADTRIHGTTRRQVGKVFREVEQATLLPLPAERFANFHEGQRTVHRDGHVEVERSYYSAPPEYVGRSVWVRWDGRLVRLFNHRFELVATHVRHLPGRFSTLDQHVPTQKRNPVDKSAQELLQQAQRLGPRTGQWAKAMLQDRGVAGIRPLLGLLSLAKKHDVAHLERACASAHDHGVYRLRTLRHLLERQPQKEESAPFLEQHLLIRPLAEYGQRARACSCLLPLEENT